MVVEWAGLAPCDSGTARLSRSAAFLVLAAVLPMSAATAVATAVDVAV